MPVIVRKNVMCGMCKRYPKMKTSAHRLAWLKKHRECPEIQAKIKAYTARPEVKARMRLYYRRGKGFEIQLKRTYGISVEDWARLYNNQNGKCVLCLIKLGFGRTTQVDHDHRTKKVRGLLCATCNRGVAWVENRENLDLKRVIAYLKP